MTMECLEYIGLRIFHFSRGLTRKTAKEVTSSPYKRVCVCFSGSPLAEAEYKIWHIYVAFRRFKEVGGGAMYIMYLISMENGDVPAGSCGRHVKAWLLHAA